MFQQVLNNKRILVVDDRSENRLLLLRVLKSFGLVADQAESGARCLEMHERDPYGIILLDIQMPGMDGIEVARRIRKSEEGVSMAVRAWIAAVTATCLENIREELRQADIDDYLPKPIGRENIMTLLLRGGGLAGSMIRADAGV